MKNTKQSLLSQQRKAEVFGDRDLTHESSPSSTTTQSATNTSSHNNHNNTKQAEIHWNPPNTCMKRHDPGTPTPVSLLSTPVNSNKTTTAMPLKTRRLLPPSRRVDDDEIGVESPPKLVRQHRTRNRSIINNLSETNDKETDRIQTDHWTRQISQNNSRSSGPAPDMSSRTESGTEQDHSPTDSNFACRRHVGVQNLVPRMESLRSMASRSMASHWTQAELEFYMNRRRHPEEGASSNIHSLVPPEWISSSSLNSRETTTTTTTSSLPSGTPHAMQHQHRRRIMLAKSAGMMLRSHRPTWDQTESMRSFCSQASSLWSLGGSSTLGGGGGMSRASSSRKSVQSGNTTSSAASGTATSSPSVLQQQQEQQRPPHVSSGSPRSLSPPLPPPNHVRTTSNGTLGKPRRIVTTTTNPVRVVKVAHRPVPTVHVVVDGNTKTSAASTATATSATTTDPIAAADSLFALQNLDLAHDITKDRHATRIPVLRPNLLDDDDEPSGDFWSTSNTAAAGDETRPHRKNENSDDLSATAFGGPWQPQPGGSFMVYRRTD